VKGNTSVTIRGSDMAHSLLCKRAISFQCPFLTTLKIPPPREAFCRYI